MPTSLKRTAITGFALAFFLVALAGIFPALADDAADPPGYKVKNQEAVQKLHQMSKQEIDNLDAIISQALTHYYDRAYALALPMFRDVAEKVETIEGHGPAEPLDQRPREDHVVGAAEIDLRVHLRHPSRCFEADRWVG